MTKAEEKLGVLYKEEAIEEIKKDLKDEPKS